MRASQRASLYAISLAAAALLAGCARLSDYAKIAEGNRLYERGDYQDAIVAYLGPERGLAGRRDSGEASGLAATIDYDVANVYARLGEIAAASELYAASRRGGSKAIAADAYFNEGVALFEQGSYKDSWRAFRSALGSLDPSSQEAAQARRNLELAWRAWKKSSRIPPRGLAGSEAGQAERNESEQRLLQRFETGRWRPGSAPSSASPSLDY